MFCVAGSGILCMTALADVSVREHGCERSLAPGETVAREVKAPDPAPYVATSPVAVSFAPKFEAPGEGWDVVMLRINLLAGRHRAVYALDIGGLGNFADYKMDGIGVAGLFNSVGESDGAVNYAGRLTGMQIGVFNYAERLNGVQIGLVNINSSSPVKFLPIANAAF